MKAALAGIALVAALAAGPAEAAEPAPKLIVAISVDQFGANLFDQWRGKFTGGLNRLGAGIVYPSGYQSHAGTETCPGHSTLLTGKHPNKTGMSGNNVRDPATGRSVYCLADGAVALAHGSGNPVGPAKLMASTLGEWVKAASPQSRVVAISSKDRAAITMAGHKPDGAFWIANGFGFTTYVSAGENAADKLAPVAAINKQIAKTWTTVPKWKYTHAECRALESDWRLGDAEFKSVLPPSNWGVDSKPESIARDVMGSPIADDMTLIGARGLIKYYNLGKGPATDVLSVSFSATDYVGHRFGAQGPEMCEQLYRLDATIGALLSDLDKLKVSYVVVLSADHGGSDFIERLVARGYQAQRFDGGAAFKRVNAALRQQLGLSADPLTGSIDEANVARDFAARKSEIATAAAKLIAAEPGIAGAFTQDELLTTPIPRGNPEELTLKERFAESTYAGRSADVQAALAPGLSSGPASVGAYVAGHGSPWNYDRRVPIIFWWKGSPAETRALPIDTVDIAPTLAGVLGIAPPSDIDGRCLPLADFGKGICPDTKP